MRLLQDATAAAGCHGRPFRPAAASFGRTGRLCPTGTVTTGSTAAATQVLGPDHRADWIYMFHTLKWVNTESQSFTLKFLADTCLVPTVGRLLTVFLRPVNTSRMKSLSSSFCSSNGLLSSADTAVQWLCSVVGQHCAVTGPPRRQCCCSDAATSRHCVWYDKELSWMPTGRWTSLLYLMTAACRSDSSARPPRQRPWQSQRPIAAVVVAQQAAASPDVDIVPKYYSHCMSVGHSSLAVKSPSFLDSGHSCLIPAIGTGIHSKDSMTSVCEFRIFRFQSQRVMNLNITISL